jgi:hypothetical protein
MQRFALFIALSMLLFSCAGESDKQEKASPAKTASMRIANTDIAINYSAPSVKDRKIWGQLVPYGQVWRTGADEATVFSTSTEIQIDSLTLPAGKYALFTIPGETEWTVILNKEYDQWGAFNYDPAKDAIRFTTKPTILGSHTEELSFSLLEVAGTEGEAKLAWEKLMLSFSFKVPAPK